MPKQPTRAGSDDLDRARRRLEAWRGRPDRGRRIPEDLWAAAVELVPRHGVSRTAQALRLDYYALKRRAESASRRGDEAREEADARFVELPVCALPGTSACVLELEDGGGTKLRMELQGLGAGDLAGLARSLWCERR